MFMQLVTKYIKQKKIEAHREIEKLMIIVEDCNACLC